MGRLSGKTALVTGAAHGQGRAFAIRLAREGADVIVTDVCAQAADVGYPLGTSAELDETVRLVEAEGRRAHAAVADVRDRDALAAAMAATAEAFPRLDVLVANAGIQRHTRILDCPPEQWQAIIDINLTGTFNVIQAFVPRMVSAGNGGSVIVMSSVAGLKSIPFCGPYVASKHGIQGLMRALAQELGEHGIRVNTLNPGGVESPMTEDRSLLDLFGNGDADSTFFNASYVPLLPLPESGFLSTDDISAAVAWLASDESAFVTGTAIPIEAGALVR
ncbi:mycofactocin-coupled SDR family oxidoreductase [Patulibacter sp. NPDC049589]|uniref:mycofactocin-coupled SDR family oxidoreductase n=1 Tax=Patulibacter sp. NPDC049589 TaxID=3154731 RepID=UPI0034478A66